MRTVCGAGLTGEWVVEGGSGEGDGGELGGEGGGCGAEVSRGGSVGREA